MTRGQHFNALLEEFVNERRYIPERTQVIESADCLSRRLQERIRNESADAHWRAWTDGHRIWLIIAELVSVPSQRDEEIALKMGFYDQDGTQAGCGVWLRRGTGQWALYCVLGRDEPAARAASES